MSSLFAADAHRAPTEGDSSTILSSGQEFQGVPQPCCKGSGGGEIRTHEAFRPSGFQDRRDQPLCHPSGAANSRSQIHYSITPLLQVKSRDRAGMEYWSAGAMRRFARQRDMFM